MPARHEIDDKSRLIRTTWEGEATDDELIEALKKYQKEIQNHPDYAGYNEMLNFSNASALKLTARGLKNIGQIASQTDQPKTQRKLALIVGSNKAYFLARMYRAYRALTQHGNKDLRIFTKESEAHAWVNNSS